MEFAAELQKIYDSESNVRISWFFWDAGIDVRLGDELNGYLAQETVPSTYEIVPWASGNGRLSADSAPAHKNA